MICWLRAALSRSFRAIPNLTFWEVLPQVLLIPRSAANVCTVVSRYTAMDEPSIANGGRAKRKSAQTSQDAQLARALQEELLKGNRGEKLLTNYSNSIRVRALGKLFALRSFGSHDLQIIDEIPSEPRSPEYR